MFRGCCSSWGCPGAADRTRHRQRAQTTSGILLGYSRPPTAMADRDLLHSQVWARATRWTGIYVALCPYLCSSLPRQDQTVTAGERDRVFAAAEQLDVSGCQWELCASCPVHTAICVCSCMSCQRLLNASFALASSLLVCILMRRHLLKCIHLVSIWPCRGFKRNADFNNIWLLSRRREN